MNNCLHMLCHWCSLNLLVIVLFFHIAQLFCLRVQRSLWPNRFFGALHRQRHVFQSCFLLDQYRKKWYLYPSLSMDTLLGQFQLSPPILIVAHLRWFLSSVSSSEATLPLHIFPISMKIFCDQRWSGILPLTWIFWEAGRQSVVGLHQCKLIFLVFHLHSFRKICTATFLFGNSNKNIPCMK